MTKFLFSMAAATVMAFPLVAGAADTFRDRTDNAVTYTEAERDKIDRDRIRDIDRERVREIKRDRDRDDYSVGDYLDDAGITTKVKADFLKQKGLDSMEIHVETTDGIVTLTGDVDHAAQIGLAESVAYETKGVRGVNNNLTLNPRR